MATEILAREASFPTPPEMVSAGMISPELAIRRRLLWVDDSAILLSLYKSVFDSLGFDVLATSSPDEALKYLAFEDVDVAILDYDMPGMNGGTLASLMKNRMPMLPVILYTGSTFIPCRAQDSVDAICDKAAPREELLTMIERLARSAAAPAYRPSSPECVAAQEA